MRDSLLTRMQLAAFAVLLLLSCAFLIRAIFFSPDHPFLTRGFGAAWIGVPSAPDSNAIPIDREQIPRTRFVKRFRAAEATGPATLTLRALREFRVELNGAPLAAPEPSASWRQTTRIPLADSLREGRNELVVEVWNPKGPALLQLRLEGPDLAIESDGSWEIVLPDGATAYATPAQDSQIFPEALMLETPVSLASRYAGVLLGLFAGSLGLHALVRRRTNATVQARLPQLVLGLVTLYWIAVFVFKTSRLPVMMGFDIPAHLGYLDILLEQQRLPLAEEGWSTYHPPLFHVLTAAIVALSQVERESGAGQVVYRLVSFSSGLASVWLTYFAARRVFRGDALKTSLAVGFVGLLPMNLVISSYVSNESLHAALLSLAFVLCCTGLLAERTSFARLVAIGAAFGLAILTKFTSLLVLPVFAVVLAARFGLDEPERPAPLRGLLAAATVPVVAFAIGGWFYLRNWLHYGSWIVWNVDPPGSMTWWEQPGFHTASYYLRFGESLRHPFFAGFYSFWDGVYSTFWGDGLLAGMIHVVTRHPMWNYDFMTLGYGLALPATLLLGVGFARMLEASFRDPDPRRRMACSLIAATFFVLCFSLFLVTFQLPYYAQAKAFYILAVTVPLSLVAAAGLAEIPNQIARANAPAWLGALYFGWLGTTAGVLALSFLA